MFSLSRSQSINHANIEEVETNPQAAWKLPTYNPSKVYQDLNMFHLKAVTRVFVKESISTIQQNSNYSDNFSFKSKRNPTRSQKRHKTQFVHFGCIRIGINALVHKGINAYVLCTVRD
jgi:hypothetical protein